MVTPWEIEEVKDINEVKERNWPTHGRIDTKECSGLRIPYLLYFLELVSFLRRIPEKCSAG
jgi:hypothetical protein